MKGWKGGKDVDLVESIAQLEEPYRSLFYNLDILKRVPSPYSQTFADKQNQRRNLVVLLIAIFVILIVVFSAYYWTHLSSFGIVGEPVTREKWDIYISGLVAIAAIGSFLLAGLAAFYIVRGQAVFGFISSRVSFYGQLVLNFPYSFQLLKQIQPTVIDLQLVPDPPIDDLGKQRFVESFLPRMMFTYQEDQLLLNAYPDPADVRQMNHHFGSPIVRYQYSVGYPFYADRAIDFYNCNVLPWVRPYDPTEDPFVRARRTFSPHVPYTTAQANQWNVLGDSSVRLVLGFLLLWAIFTILTNMWPETFVPLDDGEAAWWSFYFETVGNLFVVAAVFLAGLAIVATSRAAISQVNLQSGTQLLQGIIDGYPYSLRPAQQLYPTDYKLQAIDPPSALLPLDVTFQTVVNTQLARGLVYAMQTDLLENPFPLASKARSYVQWYTADFVIRFTRQTWKEIPTFQRCYLEAWIFPLARKLALEAWREETAAEERRRLAPPHALLPPCS